MMTDTTLSRRQFVVTALSATGGLALCICILAPAAAKRCNVPNAECKAAMSKITHKPSGRNFRFGELAAEAAAIKLDKEPALKRPDQYKFIGRRLDRLDIPLKINGSAKYGIDLEVPGMVRAAILKCPVFRGKGKSGDENAIAG